MRLINTHTIIAAFSISLALVSASPTPWSEDLLEEINSLRARGMSETDIASNYPRYLSTPGSRPLRQAPQVPTSSTPIPFDLDNDLCIEQEEPSKLRTIFVALSTKLGLARGDNEGAESETMGEYNDVGNKETWKYNGKSRLHESVGRRAQEMRKL